MNYRIDIPAVNPEPVEEIFRIYLISVNDETHEPLKFEGFQRLTIEIDRWKIECKV